MQQSLKNRRSVCPGIPGARRVFAFFLILLALCFDIAAVQGADPSSIINEAGRQRMLTQRIVLAYCQMGLGVLPQKSAERLAGAVRKFDVQLAHLFTFASDRNVIAALDQVEQIWQPFKAIATGPVDRERAKRLFFLNDDLLYASNKVVQLLQDASGTAYARLVNISGRQRMLVQRLAKLYIIREWGFGTMTVEDQIDVAKREFANALKRLESAPENSLEIKQELDRIALQWEWFVNALSFKGEAPYRLIVADASEEILKGMEKITFLYARLSG